MSLNHLSQAEELRRHFPPDWDVPNFNINFWRGKTTDYCLVIPVLNEGHRIRTFIASLQDAGITVMLDVVIVDGGSTDSSLNLEYLAQKGIRGLITKTGPGKLSAQLRSAYAFALTHGYKYIITIDGNNKDDPSAIPAVCSKLAEGFDFVQASRFIVGGRGVNTPRLRSLAIKLIHAPVCSIVSGFRWTDTTQGFRGYSRNLLLSPQIKPFREIFNTYELLVYLSMAAPRAGFKCTEVPSTRAYPLGQVPTKISLFGGSFQLLNILARGALRLYDPPSIEGL